MKTLLYFVTSFVGMAVMAMAGDPNPGMLVSPDEVVKEDANQTSRAVSIEADAPTFRPAYALWNGDGSATLALLDDGTAMLIVRIGGDPPSASLERKEPLDTYVFFLKADGLRLVYADGEHFLDRSGDVLKQRGLLPSQVSLIELGQPQTEQSENSERKSLLDLQGDMLFQWIIDANLGYFRVVDSNRSEMFEVEFTAVPKPIPDGPAWLPWCCRIHCGLFASCSRCCPPRYWAHCYCDFNGNAICECLPRSGGGSGWIDLSSVDSGGTMGSGQQSGEGTTQGTGTTGAGISGGGVASNR